MTTAASLLDALTTAYAAIDASYELSEGNRFESATAKQLKELEGLAGVSLPASLVDYLEHAALGHPFINNYTALSAEKALETARRYRDMLEDGAFVDHLQNITSWKDGRWDDGRIAHCYWNPAWIPIAEDSCGNLLCVDLTPGPQGKKGQLLWMEFQEGQGPYPSAFPTLDCLLRVHVELLKREHYTIDPGYPLEYEDLSPRKMAALLAELQRPAIGDAV